MADTIITNTPDRGDSGASAAGWIVALVIVAAVIIGGVYFYRHGAATGSNGETNINVTVPAGSGADTGGGTPAGPAY